MTQRHTPCPTTMPVFSTIEQALSLIPEHSHLRTDLVMATVMGGMGVLSTIKHLHKQNPHITIWYDVGHHHGYALEAIKIGIENILYQGKHDSLTTLAQKHNVTLLSIPS